MNFKVFVLTTYILASFYTEQSSSSMTASGEPYDEDGLTFASWNYPFGQFIRVTNLKNEKSVVVRCNDRGPAKRLVREGRVIDLSKGAFLRIAPLSDGVIEIKTEMVERPGRGQVPSPPLSRS